MRNNLLIVLSAPSGAGKTTVCRRLLNEVEGLKFSVSYTTRTPREDEKDGIDYKFVTEEYFKKLIEEGAFIEWTEVYGNYYGTLKKELDNYLKEDIDILLDLDARGAKAIKDIYKNRAVLIYLLPHSVEELKERLLFKRGETQEVINKRMQELSSQLDYIKIFDYCFINKEIDRTVWLIKAIINIEKSAKLEKEEVKIYGTR